MTPPQKKDQKNKKQKQNIIHSYNYIDSIWFSEKNMHQTRLLREGLNEICNFLVLKIGLLWALFKILKVTVETTLVC